MTGQPLSIRKQSFPARFIRAGETVDAVSRRRLETRRLKAKLRATSAALIGGRQARCGQVRIADVVTVARNAAGHAHFTGLDTCGSVWTCPVCAAKIAERRRQEVERACDRHSVAGGSIYMAAFTIPHYATQSPKELREAVAGAWRRVLAGKQWKEARARWGLDGYIRALEVTHGANGWHPHLHVLFFTRKRLNTWDAMDLSQWLFRRWRAVVERLGYGTPTAQVWRFERVEKVQQAGDYVAKWGADSEMVSGHTKTAKGGGRTPWQLLADNAEGDKRAGALFKGFAAAFKGARQLTWSRGLKDRYGVADIDDEAVAAIEPPAEVIGALIGGQWELVRKCGIQTAFLEAVEFGGMQAAHALLEQRARANE